MRIPARKFKSVEVDEFESERKQLEKARVVTVEDVNNIPTAEYAANSVSW